jgi:hypothetical protein
VRSGTGDALIVAALAIVFTLALAGVALGVVAVLRLTGPDEDSATRSPTPHGQGPC